MSKPFPAVGTPEHKAKMTMYKQRTALAVFIVVVILILGAFLPDHKVNSDPCETAWKRDYVGSQTHDSYIAMCHQSDEWIAKQVSGAR